MAYWEASGYRISAIIQVCKKILNNCGIHKEQLTDGNSASRWKARMYISCCKVNHKN